MKVQSIDAAGRTKLRVTAFAAVLAAVAILPGCVAAPFIAEAAGPAIEKSAELARWGKTESFQAVTMEEMIAAVRKGTDELGLTHIKEEPGKDKLELAYQDQRNQQIKIDVELRTARATYILVDVGWFGTEGMGDLTMRQILHNLPARVRPDGTDRQK